MSEFESKLRHGIKTPEQAEARFKRLRRIIGVKKRSGEPFDDLLLEIESLDSFLATNNPYWRPSNLIKVPRAKKEDW